MTSFSPHADVDRLVGACIAIRPELEVLVLAASAGAAGEFAIYSLRTIDKQIAVNLRSPFQLAQRLLPALRASAASARQPK